MEWQAIRDGDISPNTCGNSFGGVPVLPDSQEWPTCAVCDTKMSFYFQFELPAGIGALKEASRLLVFQCAEHTLPSLKPDGMQGARLPEQYWQPSAKAPDDHGHLRVVLAPPDTGSPNPDEEPALDPAGLSLVPAKPYADRDEDIFQVGGTPVWYCGEESYECTCGAKMQFICQLPENYLFTKKADAPEQADSPDEGGYVLCLGNVNYIFACSAQCHPLATWVTNQN